RIGEDMRLTGRVTADRVWHAGETIQCNLDVNSAHVFAAGPSGERLNRPRPADTGPVAMNVAR
ncbi:MAG: hypothetical protein AAFY90_10305, partial [Pseudomonadota bacterium]